MKVEIHPFLLSGTLNAPVSKSMMQRACAAALLRKGKSLIHNPGKSNDDFSALSVIQKLGAKVDSIGNSIVIESVGLSPASDYINFGESGLCVRMFTPIAVLSDKKIMMDGEGSLLNRSIKIYDDILPELSVEIHSNNGKLPFTIKGPLHARNIHIDGSSSSQYLTGLLMAYSSLKIDTEVSITVDNLKSKPYADLTLSVIEEFGLNVPVNDNYQKFTFQTFQSPEITKDKKEYHVEGDWSGSAFLLVAAAIGGEIILKGLNTESKQADKAILDVLAICGAKVSMSNNEIKVSQSTLCPFEFDATDCPDLFPPLVALAAYCHGKSIIKGVSRLYDKESNRALTLQEEFGKLGIEIIINEDQMIISGGEIKGSEVDSHNDHRIAMACAIASLRSNGNVVINQAECVNKSYPDFYKDLIAVGASIQYY